MIIFVIIIITHISALSTAWYFRFSDIRPLLHTCPSGSQVVGALLPNSGGQIPAPAMPAHLDLAQVSTSRLEPLHH